MRREHNERRRWWHGGWDRGLWWHRHTTIRPLPNDAAWIVAFSHYTQGLQFEWATRRRGIVIGWFHFDWRARVRAKERRDERCKIYERLRRGEAARSTEGGES